MLTLAACGGSQGQSSPLRAQNGLVDIGGGRKLYVECRGTGTPTVVLVSASGDAGDIWSYAPTGKLSDSAVAPRVAKFTRVCTYDRPGTQHVDKSPTTSTPVPQPTTPQSDVADLHAVLSAARVTGPYLLVGHSAGGAVVRAYASTYPRQVSGLVLVDAENEFLQTALPPSYFAAYLTFVGRFQQQRAAQYPEVERRDFVTWFDQLRSLRPVRPMPVVVLSADKQQPEAPAVLRAGVPPNTPADFPDVLFQALLSAQDSLARLFPGARHVSKTDSTHSIQSEQPQLVVESVRDVVNSSRHHS